MLRWSLFALLVLSSSACGDVVFRVENTGTVPLGNLQVAGVEIGDLLPGEVTPSFIATEKVYRYVRIAAVVDGTQRSLRPIDYIGEKPLRPGSYRYLVSTTVDGALLLACVEDEGEPNIMCR